jgi:hypothetical protein
MMPALLLVPERRQSLQRGATTGRPGGKAKVEQQGNVGDRRKTHQIVLCLEHGEACTKVQWVDGHGFSQINLHHHPAMTRQLYVESHDSGPHVTTVRMVNIELQSC